MRSLSRRQFLVGLGLAGLVLASGLVQIYFAYQDAKEAVVLIEDGKADGAAIIIAQRLRDVERQIAWTLQPPWTTGAVGLDQRRSDYLRLLRQVPAVMEVLYLDSRGTEVVRMSKLAMNQQATGADLSDDPRFQIPKLGRTYFSDVYLRHQEEPYLAVAVADSGPNPGVTVAEISIQFLWYVVGQTRVGGDGYAYVVDARGQVIAHSDRALQQTDFSALPQVQAALAGAAVPPSFQAPPVQAHDLTGRAVLAAHARIDPPGWVVIVEQPLAEARRGLYVGVLRTVVLAVLGLLLWLLASVGPECLAWRRPRRAGPAQLQDTL
jgi:two-component system, NtrC family, sensor kinase